MSEEARARVVASYDVDGARAAGNLDDLAEFAAELCDAPVAFVSLVEEENQRFAARSGSTLEETPRSTSFCAHAMHERDVLEVLDARADARFAAMALVTGPPFVRFYAGVPLVSSEGVPLGALCVLDTEARETGLTSFQRRGMKVLAAAAMGRLDDRRAMREQRARDEVTRAALTDSELRFRTLADTMPQMVWSTLPDGFHDYYNARWYEFTGVPEGSTDGEAWNDMFHVEDRERAWATWRHSLATGEPYQIEYRLKHFDGTYRWVLGRALPIREADAAGRTGAITRWFGTCTDIHEQKLALEEREIISQELSHRIKNIFAVIAGLIQFAARSRPEFAPAATDLRQRITALGRAHDFVRPHSPQSRPSAQQNSLHGLLEDLFAPYQTRGRQRVVVEGADLTIDDRSATPLALLFHELATNATKYGALSVEGGTVTLRLELVDADAVLTWREQGGPAAAAPAGEGGFGSRLIELAAVRQLGGAVTRTWGADGLTLTLRAPIAAFSRAGTA